MTSNGRRVISASGDRTLKVWDLETYACLLTHHGSTHYASVAAATVIVAGDAAGGVWVLDWPA
jgi:WD40 repeat protein